MPSKKEVCYDQLLTKIKYISSSFDLPKSMKDLKCHLFEVFKVCTTTKYAFSNNNRPWFMTLLNQTTWFHSF